MSHIRVRQRADGTKRYQARFTSGAHEEVQTFARRSDAKRWLLDRESALLRGELLDPSVARLTFSDLATDWIATWPGRLEPTTQTRYLDLLRLWILPHWGDQLAARITHRQVQLFLDKLAAGQYRRVGVGPRRKGRPPAAWTVRKVHGVMSAVFTEAIRAGTLKVNPARHCRLPRPGRTHAVILTMEEANALADAFTAPYGLAVRLAFSTGLRAGECWALQRRDVDLLHCRLHIERALKSVNGRSVFGPTKTHQSRSVAFPRSLAPAIEAHLATRPPLQKALVFAGPKGAAIRHNQFLQRVWTPTVRATLPPGRRPRFHDLRHAHATLLLGNGAQPLAVQRRLGHSSITTTMDIYGQLLPGADAALAAMFDYSAHATDGREAVEPPTQMRTET